MGQAVAGSGDAAPTTCGGVRKPARRRKEGALHRFRSAWRGGARVGTVGVAGAEGGGVSGRPGWPRAGVLFMGCMRP